MANFVRLLEDGTARATEEAIRTPGTVFEPIEALASWWSTQPALQALCSDGRLWFMEIPESVALPRALVTLERSVPEQWTTGFSLEKSTVVMRAQAQTAAEAQSMMNAIQPALTMATLVSNGHIAIYALPDASTYEIAPTQGPMGQDCWEASLYFEIFFEGAAPIPVP